MKNYFYHALYTIIWTLFLISGVFAQDWNSVVNMPGNWPNVDFNDLYFTDGPAWAVGKYGTIINYNGIRWQDQISNTQLELRGVYFVNTLEGWVVGDNGIILRTEDGGNVWKHQNKAGNLYDVCFVNNKYGWAVGSNGTVLRTNDGNTWTQVPIPEKYRNYNLFGVYFHNPDNGWVVGENGAILYWNGNGWQEQQQNISSANLYGVFFTSSLDGWIVGDQGTILYTNNGWLWNSGKSRAPATNANLRSIHFPRNQIQYGWIVGQNGTIFYTANYGTHWFSQKPLDTRNLNAVYAVSSSEVWAVGNNGSVIRTIDRGTNWNVFVNPPYGNLWDVSFRANWSFDNIRTLDGWIVGDNGVILRSKDDGANWYQYPSPTNKNLYSICMLGKDYGWAVGESGTIIKIKGNNWELDPPITNSHLRSVHISPASPTISNGWAVGDNGVILRWNDLDRTWTQQNSGISSDLYGVFSVSNNEGWAVGKNATILRTTNGGLNWNKIDVSSFKPDINFYQVYFHNSDNGWIVGDMGTVLYWNNGKLTEQKSNTLLSLFDVDFVDSTRGWISGENGMILNTIDGGAIWAPRPLTLDVSDIYSIDFANRDNAIAVCKNGIIIKYYSTEPPAPPVKLSLISPQGDITNPRPTFTWTTNKPNSEHTIYIDDDNDPFQDQITAYVVPIGNTSYTPDLPMRAGAYYWGIKLNDGTVSEVAKFTVWPETLVTLKTPSGFITVDSPTFQWDCNNKELESITYTLFLDKDDTPYDTQGIPVGRELTYKLTGLAEGRYSWGIRTSDGVTAKSPMKFTIDLSAPTGSIIINDGAAFTNSIEVSLRLTASDLLPTGDNGSGVDKMQFSNDGVNWSDPEPFKDTKTWNLTLYGGNNQDGLKIVYVRYRDVLGHLMVTPVMDDIILDRIPPTGTISINDGAEITGPARITLTLSATDDNSGMANGRIMLSNDGKTWSPPLPYETTRNWSFTVYGGNEDEGIKTVYAKFMDSAGNWTDKPVSDDIRFDKTGPTGTIIINDGAEYTRSNLVKLTLSASDASGIQYMHFSNDGGSWSPGEPYNIERKDWDLSLYGGNPQQGEKRVFVKFTDTAGNISTQVIFDSIIYKYQITGTIQISSPKVQGKIKNNDTVSVNGKTEAGLTRVDYEVLDENGNPVNLEFNNIKYDTKTGDITGNFQIGSLTAKRVYLRLKATDKPGNQANFDSNSLVVDNDPPGSPRISIEQGNLVNSASITVNTSATEALEMYLDGDIKGQNKWIPYVNSLKIDLTSGDGVKEVRVKFRDDLENESDPVFARTILDTTPPAGTIAINDGENLSKSFVVSLTLTASDANGVETYQLSNDGIKWTDPEKWPSQENSLKIGEWDLSLERFGGKDAEGPRTVYVKYKDKAGNWSSQLSDDIQVNLSGPNIAVELVKNRQEAMETVVVTLVIKSRGAPVVEGYLYYGVKGSRQYNEVPLVKLPGPGDYYKGEIPGSQVTLAGVDYYIVATDGIWTTTRPEKDPATTPYSFTVVDSTPPVIEHEPITKLPVRTSPKITANVTDKLGIKSVKLFYRSDNNPGGSKSYTQVDMTPGLNPTEFSANIPARDTLGVIEYYIEATDPSNNVRKLPTRGIEQPYIIYFVDTQPPVIVHTKIQDKQEAGNPVNIGATITDNMRVDSAVLKYKAPGKSEYVEVKMGNVGAFYSAEIPPSAVMPGTIEYWITASDGSPDSEITKVVYTFTVVDTTPPAIEITYLPAQVEVNTSILVEAKVTDNVRLETVLLYYMEDVMSFYKAIEMKGVGNKYTCTIPAQKNAGQVRFYIYARDSENISATEPPVNPENKPIIITVLDKSKPVIEHSPIVGVKEAGYEVIITANIKDNVYISDASLHYRITGQTIFKTGVLKETNTKSVYTGVIPGSEVMPPGVEYYIRAIDPSANVATHPDVNPDSRPHSFSVVDTIIPEIDFDPSVLKEVLVTDPIIVNIRVFDRGGIKSVTVYYKRENDLTFSSQIANFMGNDIFSASIPSPQEEVKILYYIQAQDNSGNTVTSPKENPATKPYSVFVDDPFPPLAPARLIGVSSPGGKIILSWELSKSPDTYKYNIYTDNGSGNIDYDKVYASVNMNTSSWESPPLGEGIYRFGVRAIDKSGNEEKNTNFVIVEADSTKPEKVTNLTATSRPGGRIQLNWTPSLSRDVVMYNIYWDNAQLNINYSSPLARINDPVSLWTSEPLRDGIVYRFVVRCQDRAGNEEENTDIVSARADSTPPGNITGLSSPTHKVNVWSNQPEITVSWNPAEDTGTGLAGYSILWDAFENSMPDETMDIQLISSTRYQASDIQYFHIRPVDKAGNWSPNAFHLGPFLIDVQAPQPPTSIKATPQSEGRINLTWQVSISTDVIRYNIYWDSGNGGNVDYSRILAQVSANTWTSSQLEDGRTYQFSVRAEDRAGNEEKNTQKISGIADRQKPSISHTPIAGILKDDIENITINANVVDASGLDGVKLYYRKHGESSYKEINMLLRANNLYISEIPASAFSSVSVDYYISATDTAGNTEKSSVITIEVSSNLKIPVSFVQENNIQIGDSLFIHIPAGALTANGILSVSIPRPVPEPQTGLGRHIITREIYLDTELVKALEIKLTYKDSRIIGEEEGKLAVYIWNDKKWDFISKVEASSNQVSLLIMKGGIFSILGDYEPPVLKDLRPAGYAEPGSMITAKIVDTGSGIDLKSLNVQLNGQKLTVPITALKDNNLSLELPKNLDMGNYSLHIAVSDNVGNEAKASTTFFVEGLLALKDVFAYPNPFNPSRGLNFAYTLTESVKKVTIRIFNLDGKLIKEIDGTISVGENIVKWDCLDESGDLILNQIYICHLEAEGAKGTISSKIKIAAWGKTE